MVQWFLTMERKEIGTIVDVNYLGLGSSAT